MSLCGHMRSLRVFCGTWLKPNSSYSRSEASKAQREKVESAIMVVSHDRVRLTIEGRLH